MGILGIRNRTENWKTVEYFSHLSEVAKVKLVQRLLEPYHDDQEVTTAGLQVELFWTGVRDCEETFTATQCKDVYLSLFGGLRGEIEAFIAEAKSARRPPLKRPEGLELPCVRRHLRTWQEWRQDTEFRSAEE